MSARSRYLDAISPKSNTSENEFSQSNRPKPSINTTNNSSVGVNNNKGQQQQIISPSNLQNRTINNRSINNSSNSSNNYTNSTNKTTNNSNNYTNNSNNSNNNNSSSNKTNNISTRNKLLATAPPPPPPPGPPPKRVGSSTTRNRPVIKYTGDPSINNNQEAVDNNESIDNAAHNKAAENDVPQPSPVKKGGSIWSPKNEVQSGSVKNMTMKLWGSKVNNSSKVRSIIGYFDLVCSVCLVGFCLCVYSVRLWC